MRGFKILLVSSLNSAQIFNFNILQLKSVFLTQRYLVYTP